MDQDGTWRMVGQEFEEILAFLEALPPEDWDKPSLCEGWRVQDVAVHLLVDEAFREIGWLRGLAKLAGMRFSVHRANAWWVERNRPRPAADILAIWRRSLASGPVGRAPGLVARALGPDTALRAGVIHHQDMRRPLGMTRDIPAERLLGVLAAITTRRGSINLGSQQRAAGLRLRATDVDWVHGDGPEVSGPGEALIMALAGRGTALAELHGDGKSVLAVRTPARGSSLS